jgi:hypothetical protein
MTKTHTSILPSGISAYGEGMSTDSRWTRTVWGIAGDGTATVLEQERYYPPHWVKPDGTRTIPWWAFAADRRALVAAIEHMISAGELTDAQVNYALGCVGAFGAQEQNDGKS